MVPETCAYSVIFLSAFIFTVFANHLESELSQIAEIFLTTEVLQAVGADARQDRHGFSQRQ